MDNFWVFHDSHSQIYRSPFGAVPCNTQITLKLETAVHFTNVKVVVVSQKGYKDDYLMELIEEREGKRIYSKAIISPEQPDLLWYHFEFNQGEKTYYYGNNEKGLGGIGRYQDYYPPGYQITVYRKSPVPQWFKEGIIYQIFVDRFFNGNPQGTVLNPKAKSLIHGQWTDKPFYIRDQNNSRIKRWNFFGGNLLGVLKKLDYLKSMGVTIIYFNPIFEAPSNHKYDTSDYKKIDAMFGDNDIFKELCIEAEKRGISIILDGVFSHTGSDSIYFNKEGNYPTIGAYQSQDSPFFKWYKFDQFPDKYQAWWGIDTLPNVNELEPSYQDFIIYGEDSVLKHWVKMGIRGWRLDVADELPEQFIKNLREEYKKVDSQGVLIGEVWEDASNKISYSERREYLLGASLDSVTNYPLRNILLDYLLRYKGAKDTHLSLMSLYENYPKEFFYSNMNLISSHDVPRALTVLGSGWKGYNGTAEDKEDFSLSPEQRRLGIKRLKLLALLQITFPGVPCIYYGDEVGMEGWEDPYNRGPYPWDQIDIDLLTWFQNLTRLRSKYQVFTKGDWTSFYLSEDVYGFMRNAGNNLAIILANPNPTVEAVVQIDLRSWKLRKLVDVFSDQAVYLDGDSLNITLLPLEGKILLG